MVCGMFSVRKKLVIILVVLVELGQSCPELRECFPDITVTAPCEGVNSEWTTEPSDTDCSTYLSCFNGIGIQMCCPIGKYYNPSTQDCDDEGNVDCQIEPPPCPDTTTVNPDATTTTTTNPEETTTQLPDIDTTTTTSDADSTTLLPGTDTTSTTSDADSTTLLPGTETTATTSEADSTTQPTDADTAATTNEADSTTQPTGADTTTTTSEADSTTQTATTTDETTSTAAIETTTASEGPDLQSLCSALTSDSLVELAYPGECTMYIVCENREYIGTESCPAGLHFNPTLSVCDSPDHAECLEFVCQNNPDGNQITVESLNSCQRYYICIGNITVERLCAPGTIYDAENGWCIVDDVENPCVRERLPPPPESVILQCTVESELKKIPHPTIVTFLKELIVKFPNSLQYTQFRAIVIVGCILLSVPIGITQECANYNHYTFLPDRERCHYYTACVNRTATPLVCPSGYHFNSEKQLCDYPSKAGCIKCPVARFVNLAVDGDCRKFVQCFMGTAVDRECPPGLRFDPIYSQCNLQTKCFDCDADDVDDDGDVVDLHAIDVNDAAFGVPRIADFVWTNDAFLGETDSIAIVDAVVAVVTVAGDEYEADCSRPFETDVLE
uniref:Chitin-binding type-2 domain-containing protein n=1 Tax=Anopheles minimus TaxID=112268 RepID=A0A182W3W2_9DIPT